VIDQLVNVAHEVGLGGLLQEAERAEGVVVLLEDLGGALAAKDADDVARAEALVDARDAREHFPRDSGRIRDLVHLAQAHVARPASLGAARPSSRGHIFLAEILGQRPVPAADARAEPLHLVHELDLRLDDLGGGLLVLGAELDDALPAHDVRRGVEHHALGRQPVAPRAAGLLLVPLDALGHRRVDDATHVAPVDAHAERDGRHDDVDALEAEIVLDP
jgi:hypothetical protein